MDHIIVVSLASAAAGFIIGFMLRGVIQHEQNSNYRPDIEKRPPAPPGPRDYRGRKPRKSTRRD